MVPLSSNCEPSGCLLHSLHRAFMGRPTRWANRVPEGLRNAPIASRAALSCFVLVGGCGDGGTGPDSGVAAAPMARQR